MLQFYSENFNWEINQRVLDSSERKQTTYTPSQCQNEKNKTSSLLDLWAKLQKRFFFVFVFHLVLVYPLCVGLANGYRIVAKCRESFFFVGPCINGSYFSCHLWSLFCNYRWLFIHTMRRRVLWFVDVSFTKHFLEKKSVLTDWSLLSRWTTAVNRTKNCW